MPKENDVILDSFKNATGKELLDVASPAMLVVYKNTSDYSDKYVVRLWKYQYSKQAPLNYKPTKYIIIADSIAEISKKIPWQFTFMPRFIQDDLCIVGAYL